MKYYLDTLFRLTILLPISFLSACNEDISDLKHFVEDIQIHSSGSVDAIPEPQPYQPFTYPKHNKDPFDGSALQPKIMAKPVQGVQINPNHKLQFLENFSIESIKLVGIIQHPNTLWGLIRSRDGIVHRVKVGDYVGTNHGKITVITAKKIQVVELIPNETGAYSPRNNFIHLENNQHTNLIETSEQNSATKDKEQSVD
jgi:type IV pilus assembly protein PilP